MFALQPVQERFDRRRLPLHLRNQPGGIVQHIPRELQPVSKLINKRPEAHPLHNPLQPDLNALWHT